MRRRTGSRVAALAIKQARGDLIERWDRDRQASPDRSRIILTHTNAEVRDLNIAARDKLRAVELRQKPGDSITIQGHTIEYLGSTVETQANKTVVSARVRVDGQSGEVTVLP